MNNRIKKYSILAILILLLALIITPVIAADSTDYYGSFSDSASSDDGAYTIKSTVNSSIYLFENGKNAPMWSYNIRGEILSVAISPDNKYIAVGSGGGLIWLFDQKGTVVWNKTFGNAGIKSIEFSKDSQYLDASSFMNQAFYISLEGNRATRPASTTISAVSSVTPTVTPTQVSSGPDLSWIESLFRNNQTLLLGIIIGVCLVGIVWFALSRQKSRQGRLFRLSENILTLRNFTIFSLILISAGGVLVLFFSAQYGEISSRLIIFGIIELIIAYYLCAVIFWGTDHQLFATFMLAIPLCVWYFSTNKMTGSSNPLFFIIIIIAGYALISAIILFISDKIRAGILRYIVQGKRSRYPGYPPDSTYPLIGIVVISLVLMSLGSSAVFSENANSMLKPTTGISAGPQYVPEPNLYTITPVQQSNLHTITSIPTIRTIPTINPTPVTTENYETGLTSRSFTYVLRGNRASINVNLYSGVYNNLKSTKPSFYGDYHDYYLKYIDNPTQKKYLSDLVSSIKSKTLDKDNQARIAISLVQQIPYDYDTFYQISSSQTSGSRKTRSPYEVLYDNKGVCGEKSLLLAYLLKELGYGTVLFNFDSESHMAVGIKSYDPYDFRSSGYAFVETAAPTIITDDQSDYVGVGKLTTAPDIITVSTGSSFNSIAEEYKDAKTYNQIRLLIKSSPGGIIDQNYYYAWMSLVQKYGLKTSNN